MLNQSQNSGREFGRREAGLPKHERSQPQNNVKRDIEIIPLQVDRAQATINKNKDKDPKFSQNLRWVQNTPKNRQILHEYIITRMLINKFIHSQNFCYSPCCNVFSLYRPPGKGHKGIKHNPFLYLLDNEERAKVNTFKKILLVKHASVPKKQLKAVLKPEGLNFFFNKLKMRKLRKFIEDLPKKEGCFHLPLVKERYKHDCPGPSPLLRSGCFLDFKVDLFTIKIELDQLKEKPPITESFETNTRIQKARNKEA